VPELSNEVQATWYDGGGEQERDEKYLTRDKKCYVLLCCAGALK